MKKKNLSFMTLFMLTASLIGGCSCNKQSNENVSNLVLKFGDKEYSAKDLYNELLASGTGANEAFAKVLRLVVESSMETTKNIQSAADLAVESFEEEVETDSLTNGTSKEDSREKLLEEKGYSSIEEMKSDIIYKEKLTRITESYWEENKGNYFNQYMEARLPYLIRHVLVKIDDSNANKITNNVAISKEDGEKLFDVIKRFENGDKFSYVANQESEDTGSTANGGAYYMDNTSGVNGFVDEFVYGTYAFDAYTTKNIEDGVVKSYTYGPNQDKLSKLTGLTDTETFAEYYQNGFNFVDMAYVNMMGEVYNKRTQSDRDYFDINAYNKIEKEGEETTYESATGNLNSEENAYASNILFNRVFNKPGVSVIGYNSKDEIPEGVTNYVELKMSATESKYVLTDEKGNIIFFVVARGSSNALWVHFLTINVSSLDDFENAKTFFGLTYNEADDVDTYIELMNKAGTSTGANTVIKELEGYVKSYATYGNGGAVGEESILKLDMVQYYMKKNNIEFESTQLKEAIEAYIANKKDLLQTKLLNSMSDDWDTHTDKLAMSMSDMVQKGIKPFECAVLLPNGVNAEDNPYTILSYNTDSLCRYVYGEGYEVQLIYAYKTGESSTDYTRITTTTSNNAYFAEGTEYTQWAKIGEDSSHIILPAPTTASGYKFEGWFTDKALTQEVDKNPTTGEYYIDLSTSKMDNKTIFFAKVTPIDATTITYRYQYADGTKVGDELTEILNSENDNVKSQKFVKDGNNTITISEFDSDYVTITEIDKTSITLTADDSAKTIEVIVTVAPIATTIEYIYVDASGNDASDSASVNPNATTITYGTGTNTVTLSKTGFKTGDNNETDYLVSGFKVTKGHVDSADRKTEFVEIEEQSTSIALEETDAGQVITVFVIVAGGNA